MDDCLFCKIRDGEIPAEKVYDDEQCLAFRDVHPQAPTHVLIIPRKHIASLLEVEQQDCALLGHLQWVAAMLARRFGLDKGFRTIINNGRGAGQSVFHVHVHLMGGRPMSWPPG